jgi:phenylpropionate dioxygenase-like ring-hydroxylating dioxygenase large terminal subunit
MNGNARLTIDGVDLTAAGAGRLLPPRVYTSPGVYDVEMERIFARSWVHVADLSELGEPGDFVAAHIGPTPVLVVRGRDREVRAFLNACRHRGTLLAEGRGNCGRSLDCPYHAWSFGLDGRLLGVPEREEFTCDLAGMNLVPVRVATLGPMVFGCLDPAAPPFGEWAGELSDAMTRARGAEMTLAFEFDYDVDVNWKVYVENGLEGYHVRFVHDVLNDLVETKTARHFFEEHGSYTHALIRAEYRGLTPRAPHLSEEENGFIRFGLLFPNLIPVLGPNELSYLRIDPVAPERIRLVARSFDLGGEAAEVRDFRRDSFDRTNRQDIAVVTRVQRGLRARGLPAGVHSSFLECRIGHFQQMVRRALVGDETRSLRRAESVTFETRDRGETPARGAADAAGARAGAL